ncbi:MAG: M20/M25/M40 family metallo-hydrolase [Lentisphaeria bacterium]|nr:M20/M25/M40 family metallo-hydrolase [Lentisphaeria bacterium]
MAERHCQRRIDRGRLMSTLRNLVDVYSPSGKETEVMAFSADLLASHGWQPERHRVSPGRFNIKIGASGFPRVAFVGHLDTVPAFDVEHIGYREVNGRGFGLGTADMKSGCAAMLEAFIAAGPDIVAKAGAALFLVVGEEENADGITALLDDFATIPWAVVAEPTDLRVCLSHYGYVEMALQSFGTRRHAAMAGREYNAIHSMLGALLDLGNYVELSYPKAVMNIRDLHSSQAGFAVPDRCAAWVDVHISPAFEPAAVAGDLRAVAERALETGKTVRHELDFPTQAKGFESRLDNASIDALKRACADISLPWKKGVFRSHSDANLMYNAGCQPVILGPGQLARAHTRDESVEIAQVVRAAELYLALLVTLAGSDGMPD